MQPQAGMFLLTRFNSGFRCPEFFANGGTTLHTDKAVKAFSFREALALLSTFGSSDSRWTIVAAEDVSSLPGF